MTHRTKLCHLLTTFVCIWGPLTWYWAQLPNDKGWLFSPVWNSFYLFLIGMVVIVGWVSKFDNVRHTSIYCLAVYVMARAIYGTNPEYHWATPIIDSLAFLLCVFMTRQWLAAGFFLVMVINFCAAKILNIEPWRWQLRSNGLFILQCLSLSFWWSLPQLRQKYKVVFKKPPPDNIMKLEAWHKTAKTLNHQ